MFQSITNKWIHVLSDHLDLPLLTAAPCHSSLCVDLQPPQQYPPQFYNGLDYQLQIRAGDTGAQVRSRTQVKPVFTFMTGTFQPPVEDSSGLVSGTVGTVYIREPKQICDFFIFCKQQGGSFNKSSEWKHSHLPELHTCSLLHLTSDLQV